MPSSAPHDLADRGRGPQALAEIARVSARHSLTIDPFQDVNRALWPRLNVSRRDYFRGRIDDLRHYGLEPALALGDFPRKPSCGPARCWPTSALHQPDRRVQPGLLQSLPPMPKYDNPRGPGWPGAGRCWYQRAQVS